MEFLPQQFQLLTPEDEAFYGRPELIYLDPPEVGGEKCMRKRNNWIKWRAAPYEAERHSEYLYIPELDSGNGPPILLSAVITTPCSISAYLETVPGKRRYNILGKKAIKAGYTARPIQPAEESLGIWQVIHSCDRRQGRPIASTFEERPPDYSFPEYINYDNPYYDDICCGVFAPDKQIVAYLLGKRVGHHVQYDEIMGHADHLYHDIMYLLHIHFLKLCIDSAVPPGCLNYGPWYSGVDPYSPEGGLNRWKRKVRFKPAYLIYASS